MEAASEKCQVWDQNEGATRGVSCHVKGPVTLVDGTALFLSRCPLYYLVWGGFFILWFQLREWLPSDGSAVMTGKIGMSDLFRDLWQHSFTSSL